MSVTDRTTKTSFLKWGIPIRKPAKILHVLWAYPVALILAWMLIGVAFVGYTGYRDPGVSMGNVFLFWMISGAGYALLCGIPILGAGFGLAYFFGGLVAGNTGKPHSGSVTFAMALGLVLGCFPMVIFVMIAGSSKSWPMALLLGCIASAITIILLAFVRVKPQIGEPGSILYHDSNYENFTALSSQLPPLWHGGVSEVVVGGMPRYAAATAEDAAVMWPHITYEGVSYPLKYLAQIRTGNSELLVFYGLQDETVPLEDWYFEWGANAVIVDNLPVPPWVHFQKINLSDMPLWSGELKYLPPTFLPTVRSVPFDIPKDSELHHVLYQIDMNELSGEDEIMTIYWNGHTKAELTIQ